jgi:mTERF domain-containing protein
MQPKDILKLLTSYPFIMDYSLENHMLPIARYFLADLEFSPMEMKRILLKFPRLMSHSMFKIKHVVGYLRFQLGMNAKEVKRVLFQAPQVISLNTDEKVASKVAFLRDAFGLTNGSDLRKVIAGMPTVLLCNTEDNVRPKAEYLLGEFGGDRMEMRQAVITLPTLLGYSLEKRIKPRMLQILDSGMEPIKITIGITMTEEKFQEWLGASKKAGRGWLGDRDKQLQIVMDSPSANGMVQNEEEFSKKEKETISEDGKNKSSSATSTSEGRIVHWRHSSKNEKV